MRRVCGVAMFLILAVTACGESNESAEDEGGQGRAETEDAVEGPYVLNHYEDEEGFADEQPENYVATEFTNFSDLEWEEWSEDGARGEGEVSGTWCLDMGCDEDPYDVDIELGDPVNLQGALYFSSYTVTEYDDDMPEEARQAMEEADGGNLVTPPAPE